MIGHRGWSYPEALCGTPGRRANSVAPAVGRGAIAPRGAAWRRRRLSSWCWSAVVAGALATALSPVHAAPLPALAWAYAVPWRTGLGVEPALMIESLSGGAPAAQLKLELPARARKYQHAAQRGDWEQVISRIDLLPRMERNKPITRYAFAVAASRTGDCKRALERLSRLERALPELRTEIVEMRAACQREVGPYGAAASHYAQLGSAEGLVRAAEAQFNGRKARKALPLLRKALRKIGRRRRSRSGPRRGEAEARGLLAQVALAVGERRLARSEYLWLATEAPTHPAATDAPDQYAKLSGRALTKEQHFKRAELFAEAGEAETVDRELDLMRKARGQSPERAELDAVRAWAYYRGRTRYEEASELFKRAAAADPKRRVRHLYYAARALSRAQQDRQAIVEFRALADRYPKHNFGERARYRVARLYAANAQWSRADRAFGRYLKQFPRGRFVAGSRKGRALAHLLLGKQLRTAASTFANLAEKEDHPGKRALLAHLQALALARAGDSAASRAFREVVEQYPFSFAAFASAARLRQRSEPVPPPHGPRASGGAQGESAPEPIRIRFPEKSRLLATAGLLSAAEQALHEARATVRAEQGNRGNEALCKLYERLDRGQRALALSDYALRRAQINKQKLPEPEWEWAYRCHYPRAFSDLVESAQNRHGLPQGLAYAIMRQESGFRPEVLSRVGAQGLMQLMPRTARLAGEEFVARAKSGDRITALSDTNVLKNVELGAFYLSRLLDMFRDVLPVAIASYNAGPVAASRWLESSGHLPLDLWVACIPYAETRGYVLRVMHSWAAYGYLDGAETLPGLSLQIPANLRASPDAY